MLVADTYKYKLHFRCASCGHTWLVGHHVVTLEEPCPLGFCPDDPIENHDYERTVRPMTVKKSSKLSGKRAA